MSHLAMAWRAYTRCWKVFTLGVLGLFGSWVLLEIAVYATQQLGLVVWIALHLSFLLVFSGLIAGFHALALTAIDGGQPTVKLLFASLDRGPALLAASIVAFAAIGLGLLLLVAPGIYLATRYFFIGQVASQRSESPFGMLKESDQLTRRNRLGALAIVVIVVLISALGAALAGVGLIVMFPVAVLTASSFYKSLRQNEATP